MVGPGRCCDLDTTSSHSVQPKPAIPPQSGAVRSPRRQPCQCDLLHPSPGFHNPLGQEFRYQLELPAHTLLLQHGSLRGADHDLRSGHSAPPATYEIKETASLTTTAAADRRRASAILARGRF